MPELADDLDRPITNWCPNAPTSGAASQIPLAAGLALELAFAEGLDAFGK